MAEEDVKPIFDTGDDVYVSTIWHGATENSNVDFMAMLFRKGEDSTFRLTCRFRFHTGKVVREYSIDDEDEYEALDRANNHLMDAREFDIIPEFECLNMRCSGPEALKIIIKQPWAYITKSGYENIETTGLGGKA